MFETSIYIQRPAAVMFCFVLLFRNQEFSVSERQVYHSSPERAHYSVIPANNTTVIHSKAVLYTFFFPGVMAHTHLTTIQSNILDCRESSDVTTKKWRRFL